MIKLLSGSFQGSIVGNSLNDTDSRGGLWDLQLLDAFLIIDPGPLDSNALCAASVFDASPWKSSG